MKKQLLFAIFLLCFEFFNSKVNFVIAQSPTGPNNPSANSTDNANTGFAWGTPTQIYSQNDTYSSYTGGNLDRNEVSDNIILSGFGFNVPCGNAIDGILVELEGQKIAGTIIDNVIQLVDATGTPVGDNKASGANWVGTPDADAYIAYGGAADKWGLTLTRNDINSTSFGVKIQIKTPNIAAGDNSQVQIDHVRITIWYSPAVSTITSNSGGDWSAGTTWVGGVVPSACDNVVIASGHIVTVSTDQTCNNLTMSGGTLSWTGNKTITVDGNFTANGGATSTIEINGGGANPNRKINVTGTCTIDAGATLSMGGTSWTQTGATNIDGTLTFSVSASGNKTFNSPITISATGTFNNATGETPTINANITNSGSWIGCTGGTCTYTLGAVAGTYSINGNAIAMSILSIGNAATIINNNGILVLDGTGPNVLTGSGTFNNTATGVLYLGCAGSNVFGITFNASTADNTVYYNYSGNQTMAIPSDGGYSKLNASISGTKTMAGNFGVGSLFTIEDAAIVDIGINTLNGAGGLTMTGTSEFRIGKCAPTAVPELTGTYTLSAGTINLNGACDQTWNSTPIGSTTCFNMTLDNSGSKNICGITTINGNLTISGSASLASCVTYFTQSCIKTFTYSSTGTTTLGANISLGSLSQTAGTLNDGGFTITVCGLTWSRSAGTFTATGRVTFNGTTTVSGAATTNFNNITINVGKTLIGHTANMGIGIAGGADFTNNGTFTHNSGTVTSVGAITIAGTSTTTFNHLTISTGILTGHSANMNIEGNWTNDVASGFTHNSGTVTFTGGNAQNLAGTQTTTFNNLTVNKTAGTILTQTAATATVATLLNLTEGIFDINTNTLNGAGGFTATGGDLQMAKTPGTVPELTGAYAVSGGTVTLDGAGIQTLNSPSFTAGAGSNTYNNLVFTTSGAKTITGLLTITGDVTVSGTATLTANSAFTQATGKTFYYNSTAGTTTLTALVDVIIGSYSQAGAAGTLDINSNSFTVRGSNWSKTNGTFSTSGTVIFQGSSAQTFSETAPTTFNNVTIDNASGVTLSSDMTINSTLNFNTGNIVTGSNVVIIALTTGSVTRTSGHVHGNLRKAIVAGVSAKTYEVGTGTNYTPVDFSFDGTTTAGNLTCSSTSGDHGDILASLINPSKSINRYWTITNNSIATLSYSAIFNFIPGIPVDVDAAANTANVEVQDYNGTVWNTTTIGTRNPANTQITGEAFPTIGNSRYYQIGEPYIPASSLWNAKISGSYNWSDPATWIQDLVGSIAATSGSTTVTCPGMNCGFISGSFPLVAGDILLFQSTPGTVLGTIASITDDNTLELTAPSAVTNTEAFGRQKVPSSADIVNIGNPNLPGGPVTIILDVPAITGFPPIDGALRVNFTSMAQGNTLQHNAGMELDVVTNLNLKHPSNANTNSWNINAGSATIGGNLTIGSTDGAADRISRVALTTGTLNITTNLIYSTPTAANAVIDLTGGAGRVNLSGALTLSSAGTLSTAGSENVFNYNGSTSSQTVTFGSSIVYKNLFLNNTNASGVSLGAAVTTANITGDIRTQTGLFTNGGFSIAGNGTEIFEVMDGATFRMTGMAAFPTGFGTFTNGITSTNEYWQSNGQNISVQTYGNLSVQPSTNITTHTFQAGTTTVAGNLVLGNGTNTGVIVNSTGAATIDVNGNLSLSANTTFNISASTATPVVTAAGEWANNGGTFTPGTKTVTFDGGGAQQINGSPASQTFYDIIVAKTAGTTLTVGGSTTTLNVNNYTNTTGNFTAPATFDINGNITLSAGTFTAGANTTVAGNWTNNGGTFTNSSGTVTFDGGAGQTIDGTAASQTFNNVILLKAAGTVSAGGSTIDITANNFTQTTGSFTAPATMNIIGIFTLTAGTYTAGANSNLGGNIVFNGGTWTAGTTTTLNGSTAQTLSGSSTYPVFTNFTVNNSKAANAVTLAKPISIDGVFTLTDGHLIADATNTITLTDNATVTLNAPVTQDSSFIKGPMSYQEDDNGVSATKIFPVGNGDLLHKIELTLTHSSAGTNTYTAIYYVAADAAYATTAAWTLPGTLDKVSGMGHWDLSKSGASTLSIGSVKLHYFAFDDAPVAADLRVAKGNPSAWADIGGTGTADVAGYIISTINFTSFSRFALANRTGGGNPLPVELLSFNAELNNNTVDLTWATASEINNDYFTVEKTKDGKEFREVIIVKGNGNSNALLDYFAIDENPYKGISYYRLKQTDFDGRYTYSELVVIDNSKRDNVEFIIFPNPSNGKNINVSFRGNEKNEEVLVVLNDIEGKEVYSKVMLTDDNGSFIVAVDTENRLPAGIYLIVGSSRNDIFSRKLVIK